jgi:hypothetical protein
MRFWFALVTCCAFLFLAAGFSRADEISDLKTQVQKLMQRIEEMEKKQKEQEEQTKKIPKIAKSVEKIEKEPSAAQVVEEALSKKINMGAHLKFFLADRSQGESNDQDQSNTLAAGISDTWLYFRKSINDWLAVDVAPVIQVNAAATPTLGGDINRSNSASVDIDYDEAYMTIRAPYPYDVELKAGAFYPMFSEEYASKTWWHEQYHGNQGLLNLQHWQSTGLEIYRNFDFESFSLPVYFYPYINGEDRTRDATSRYTDNNDFKNMLLHVSPEFFAYGTRFKLLGSLGWGRWDNSGNKDSYQYAAGLNVKRGSLELSGEYLSRHRDGVALLGGGHEDAQDKGFYVRALYTINPKWRALVKYSNSDLFVAGTDSILTDNYKTTCFALNYWIVEGSSIIPQIEFVNASESGSKDQLDYWRYTLGWRTTF